jgi:hypothetical protein
MYSFWTANVVKILNNLCHSHLFPSQTSETCSACSVTSWFYYVWNFSIRIVNTTRLVSTVQNVKMVSMATREMELRMIAESVHVNHPRQPREFNTHFTDMCIPHFFSLPNGVRRRPGYKIWRLFIRHHTKYGRLYSRSYWFGRCFRVRYKQKRNWGQTSITVLQN